MRLIIYTFSKRLVFICCLCISCATWTVKFNRTSMYSELSIESVSAITIKIFDINIVDQYKPRRDDILWTKDKIDSAGIKSYSEYNKRWLKSKHIHNVKSLKNYEFTIKNKEIIEINRIVKNDTLATIYLNLKNDGNTYIIAFDKLNLDTCFQPIWIKNGIVYIIKPISE